MNKHGLWRNRGREYYVEYFKTLSDYELNKHLMTEFDISPYFVQIIREEITRRLRNEKI